MVRDLIQPTIVILAAAKVGDIGQTLINRQIFILQNLRIQTNVIENAWKFGVRRLLF